MISTMLLVGLVTRRLWAIPVGALAWGVLVLAAGAVGIGGFPLAAFIGGANMVVGVLIHRGAAWLLRRTGAARARPAS